VLVILLVGAMLLEAGNSADLRFLLFGQAIAGQLEPLLRSIGVEGEVPLGPEAARTQLQALMGVVGLFGAGALPIDTEVRQTLEPFRSAARSDPLPRAAAAGVRPKPVR
jgi:hypothetical protein